jgi:Thioredoxin domain-containing protein 17-like, thioredoxin domain
MKTTALLHVVVHFGSMQEEKEIEKLTAEDLYRQFQNSVSSFARDSWHLTVFEGSPEDGLYSWCPDCVVASTHIRHFEEYSKESKVKLLKFKVGSKDEWESKTSDKNPFKQSFPLLQDVPTAILFLGKLDVCRVIAPQESDLIYMCQRIGLYEEQIESGQWHVPLRFTR